MLEKNSLLLLDEIRLRDVHPVRLPQRLSLVLRGNVRLHLFPSGFLLFFLPRCRFGLPFLPLLLFHQPPRVLVGFLLRQPQQPLSLGLLLLFLASLQVRVKLSLLRDAFLLSALPG